MIKMLKIAHLALLNLEDDIEGIDPMDEWNSFFNLLEKEIQSRAKELEEMIELYRTGMGYSDFKNMVNKIGHNTKNISFGEALNDPRTNA